MGPEELEADHDSPVELARARRGLSLIVVSLLVIAVTGLAYVRPSLGAPRAPIMPSVPASYQLAAVDFVGPTTGWFAATFNSGRFAILHTSDAGRTWTRQLAGETNERGLYMQFFDSAHGMLALLGAQPLMFRTADGGRTWSSHPGMSAGGYVLSMSFVDPQHGWLLTRSGTRTSGTGELFRTLDGGTTWGNLGSPVLEIDQAYRVQFTDLQVGWLDSASARPYAYKTVDGGASWQHVPLPAPSGGWPDAGQFFVAAQPTQGSGVVATIVNFAPYVGRSGIGERVVAYPPLTVRAFDGGLPVFYSYATFADVIPTGGMKGPASERGNAFSTQGQATNQVRLGSLDSGSTWSVIAPPNTAGAIGYSDAQNWWWIGSGAWSTSSDGGTTWTPYRNVGVLQPLPGSLNVLDSKHAWFGAMAGTKAVLETTADGGVRWEMIVLPTINPS